MTRAAWMIVAGLAACRASQPPVSPDGGWRAFADVVAVLQSPRCVSCHIPGDAPLQGDDGRLHTMNVKRGVDGRGTPALRCTTCHQDANTEALHAPPGVPDWRLPPPTMRMAWQGLSPEAMCRRLKDPGHTGGRDLAGLEEHLRHDPLVAWSFAPGPGRRLPPLSHRALIARFVEWKDAGAPCSASKPDDR